MRRLEIAALVLLFAAFAWGLAALLGLRAAAGDVYPAFSTLRTDARGAKAIHDAVAELDGVAAARGFIPPRRLGARPGTTVVFAGVQEFLPSDGTDGIADDVESLAIQGARVVVTMAPDIRLLGVDLSPAIASFPERWHLETVHEPLARDEDDLPLAATVRRTSAVPRGSPLPRELAWHAGGCFAAGPEWTPIYSRRACGPVVLERRLGRGAVVVAGDAWSLSNQALRDDRQPAFLAWLVGGASVVIFDETHLGVRDAPGVASLLKRYRLHGAAAAIALFAGLCLWRAAAAFPPPAPERESAGAPVEGRDAASGLLALLRRAVPGKDILKVCAEEWRADGRPHEHRHRAR